jgi:hypothetical protein
MIARKQQSGLQFNQLIDARFSPVAYWPVAVSAAIGAKGKPLGYGDDIPWSKVRPLGDAIHIALGRDALAPWGARSCANQLLRTLCCLLKQALHLKLAGHAFA